jgi:hypothetical protein
VQIPWESAGWSFTAVALFEPTQNVGGGYSGSSSVENPGGSGVNPSDTGTLLRDVLAAVDVTGLSYKETSRALRIPEGTVMSRLYRARQQLVRRIEGGGD